MALEKLEESIDYIIVLKKIVAFYVKMTDEQINQLKTETATLSTMITQASETMSHANRMRDEVVLLTKEKSQYQTSLDQLKPYSDILQTIDNLHKAIRDKEDDVERHHQLSLTQRRAAIREKDNPIAQENTRVEEMNYERVKALSSFEINRLLDSIKWQECRLVELGVTSVVINSQVADLRAQLDRLDSVISQKRGNAEYLTASLKRLNSEIQRLKDVDQKLQEYTRDRDILTKMIRIIQDIKVNGSATVDTGVNP